MEKYRSLALTMLTLTGLIIGSGVWTRLFYTSIQDYRSPFQMVELTDQRSVSATTGKVVVILIEGLGYDESLRLDLPNLERLRQSGANAAIQSAAPTYSQTAWATLLTGAPAATNDAPPLDIATHLLKVDTVFTRLQAAESKIALIGPAIWRQILPRNDLDYTFFVDQRGAEADRIIVETALPFLTNEEVGLVFIHLTQVNVAGLHQGGPGSAAYGRAVYAVDSYLGQLSLLLDLSHTALIVLSDHGHIEGGGYGGDEPAVIWQPLVMVGEGIIPGDYSDVHQTDIAPTLTTLLGAAPPAAAQGRILFEMLNISPQNQVMAQLDLSQQQLSLTEAYLTQIQATPIPEALAADLAQAQTFFMRNNNSGALQLARQTHQQAAQVREQAKANRLRSERRPRLILAGTVAVIWLMGIWRTRGPYTGSVLVAVVATVGLYHLLYWLQGNSYSLSSIQNIATLPSEVARRLAVSLLAGGSLLLIFLMLIQEEESLVVIQTGYALVMLVTFIFALPLFWTFWQNGFVVSWHLPAPNLLFWRIISLSEVMAAAILGLLFPWPLLALNGLVSRIRR